MLKFLKKIILWSIIPLLFEIGMLTYMDKFHFAENGNYKIEKVNDKIDKMFDKNVSVPIPDDAIEVKLSYDGKYVSYRRGNTITIVNTLNGDSKNVEIPSRAKVCYYTWFPDRYRMYIAEKFNEGSTFLKLCYYDVDKDERAIVTNNHYNEVIIHTMNSKCNVNNIVVSTLTGVQYVSVDTTNGRSNIYRLNIMSQLEKYRQYVKVGNIDILNRDDRLLYEDLAYGKVRVSDRKNSIRVNGENKLCLLGVDSNDDIYLGGLSSDNKVKTIYYGSIKDDNTMFKNINLDDFVSKEQIHISKEGKIYVNYEDDSYIREVLSGDKKKYSGKVVTYYNSGIGVIKNGKFKRINLEK